MDRTKSDSRLFGIILAQTDTTVGFLSLSKDELYRAKNREKHKSFIKVFSDFASLSARVPQKYKSFVRRAKKTTFIVKQDSFRVAKNPNSSQILKNSPWFYSTSANLSGKKFDLDFAQAKADIIIQNIDGLKERDSSKIFKINNYKKIRIR
ncbi:MAG: hypothetical protein RBS91_01760 [Sulfurimonadaceae bacterium]|nr:hypothetical protein [Sulfurimonadaceae bacterium]